MTLIVAEVRPNALVAYNVYIVDCVGVTTTLLSRRAPTPGVTAKYDAPVAFQLNVTAVPGATDCELAVKLPTLGFAPEGRLADVYTGLICTTSKSAAVRLPRLCRSSLSQRSSGAPLMYMDEPLSAMIIPYFFSARRIT